MKKLIALLLSVLLALTSMAPAYAAKPYLENQNFSIEASIDELADGITFAIIQEADGSLTVQKIEQSDIALQANQRVAGTLQALQSRSVLRPALPSAPPCPQCRSCSGTGTDLSPAR